MSGAHMETCIGLELAMTERIDMTFRQTVTSIIIDHLLASSDTVSHAGVKLDWRIPGWGANPDPY